MHLLESSKVIENHLGSLLAAVVAVEAAVVDEDGEKGGEENKDTEQSLAAMSMEQLCEAAAVLCMPSQQTTRRPSSPKCQLGIQVQVHSF